MNIGTAYYIKLGKGGEWVNDSIPVNLMRIGWPNNSLDDINGRNWDTIQRQIQEEVRHRGTATSAYNSLRHITESSEEDVWITFHASCLWWCRLAAGPVEGDKLSKFRRTSGPWQDSDVRGTRLLIAKIPGVLSQLQGFRGTVCKVREVECLRRLLDGEWSEAYKKVNDSRLDLVRQVEAGLKGLHWKDFETLVDLVFRQAGWRRISILGETMKYADLELEEPINGERYQVQVKSQAGTNDFADYRDQFRTGGFRKLFFVVHSPEENLTLASMDGFENVQLILPNRLAEMVVDAGLVNWLLDKIR